MQPQITQLYERGYKQYEERLEPTVVELTKLYEPWWRWTKKTTSRQYHTVFIPIYKRSLPYLHHVSRQARHYTINYAIPTIQRGANTATIFVQRHLWPTIRIAWGQHVEPQILKIQAKIASYADGRKMEAAAADLDDITTSSQGYLSSLSSSASSFMSSLSPTIIASSSTFSTDQSADSSHFSDTISQAVETVSPVVSWTSESSATQRPAETTASSIRTEQPTQDRSPMDDVRKWELKFTRAAEQGSKDLQNRLSDIISRQIDGQVKGVGQALLTRLEVEVEEALENVRTSINHAVQELPADSSEDHKSEALHNILEALRTSGKSLKDRAQQVREWKAQYDIDTESLIEAATTSTLSVLDGIRDLGLQKIGMQWAEMEDVSYDHWTEYHQLKQKFDVLRANVVADTSQHRELAHAKKEAYAVQDAAMTIAEGTAKELARLKDVARWKIEARDASDDFSTRHATMAAVKEFGQKVAGMFGGESDVEPPSAEVLSTVSSLTESAPSSITEDVVHTDETIAESIRDQSIPIKEATASVVAALTHAIDSATSLVERAEDSLLSVAPTLEASLPAVGEIGESLAAATSNVKDSVADIAAPMLTVQDIYSSATTDDSASLSGVTSDSITGSESTIVGEPIQATTTRLANELEEEDREVPEDVRHDLESSIAPSAQAAVTSAVSIAAEYGHSIGGTVAPAMSGSMKDGIVNGAYQASSSLQGRFSEAGEGLAEMTSSLANAAKESASSVLPQ